MSIVENVGPLDSRLDSNFCTHFKNKHGRVVRASDRLRLDYRNLQLTPCLSPEVAQPKAPAQAVPVVEGATESGGDINPLDEEELLPPDAVIPSDEKPAPKAPAKKAPAKKPSAAAAAKAAQ